MDFGKLFLLKEEKQESLQHFIEAFLIYRTTFDEDTLQTGEAALYIANLLEEQKRFEEAFKYVEIAARNYEYAYETGNPKTIKVLWQKISISYALEKPETEAYERLRQGVAVELRVVEHDARSLDREHRVRRRRGAMDGQRRKRRSQTLLLDTVE